MARGISIDTSAGQAPDVAAAADVVVVERMGQPTRFELQIPANVKNGDYPAFLDARFDPGQAISIFVDDQKLGLSVLCSGEVDGQSISVVDGGEGSAMTVLGGDVTIAMDREVKVTQWSAPLMTDGAIAMAICGMYAIICVPEQTSMTRTALGHPLVQRKTDLAFIQQLARRNGYAFWVRSMAAAVGPVVHTAYFQKLSFADGMLAELRCNAKPGLMDKTPNTIDRLDLSFAATAPTEVQSSGVDIAGVSDFTADTQIDEGQALGTTSVAQIGAGPRVHRMTATGDSAGDLTPKGDAILASSQFFLEARTSTTAQRLGAVIRAHDTVRVMGAGSRHSGRYYVAGVTHRINEVSHTMDLHLIRNAWGEDPPGLLGGIV